MDQVFDVAIIGGGINGCGCAADAAARGLSVLLLEQDDLASKTSSSSTKLIHGGLRYLENYEFKLVKKALMERQTLLNLAPYLVHPQSFILPYQKHMRPAWLLRLGLFFYDHLSRKNRLPKCKSIHRTIKNNYFTPLIDKLRRGFLFYDATTDDARLTVINAIQARSNGADIRTHSTVIRTEVVNNLWQVTIRPAGGLDYTIYAKSIINAAGPWIDSIAKLAKTPLQHHLALVKGSHFIVPKLYEGHHAYFLQHTDKRVVFIIPYQGFSMIGTTEVPYSIGEIIQISPEEIEYLLGIVNTYFKSQIHQEDIISSWSGVRPLLAAEGKSMKSLSRDYSFDFILEPAPMITIMGGKITTYRQLAEETINKLSSVFPDMPESQTKSTPLPGANLGAMNFNQYIAYAHEKYKWLGTELLNRYLFSYGTRMELFLGHCTHMKSLGTCYGKSLYQVEVDYLVREEWARDVDDILMRRTKLGLNMDDTSKQQLASYLAKLTISPVQAEPVSH